MKNYDGGYEKPVIRATKRRYARGPLPETALADTETNNRNHMENNKPALGGTGII